MLLLLLHLFRDLAAAADLRLLLLLPLLPLPRMMMMMMMIPCCFLVDLLVVVIVVVAVQIFVEHMLPFHDSAIEPFPFPLGVASWQRHCDAEHWRELTKILSKTIDFVVVVVVVPTKRMAVLLLMMTVQVRQEY